MNYVYLLSLLLLALPTATHAQQDVSAFKRGRMRGDSLRTVLLRRIEDARPDYNADSVRAVIESGPYFGIFRDNYFIGGIPIGGPVRRDNANVKFQISIIHRLTKSRLPFDTYLFLQFTQKTIWNVLEESLPMRDLNFNPGVGLGHLIVYHNKYIGHALFMLEHESNGKDGPASRSWNKVSLSSTLLLNRHMEMQLKAWIPIVDGENNRNILRYSGLAQMGLLYRTDNRRVQAGMLATWRAHSFSFNTQWELSLKISRHANQYLFFQYYNGYGENLLDYDRFKSVLRLGMVIKPEGYSIY